jgi:hypothetical protein
MGLDYSVELFFPIENIKAALEATVENAGEFKAETTIMLPNGDTITVPFANKVEQLNNGTKEEVELNANKSMRLILVMRFPFDETIEKFIARSNPFYLAAHQGEADCRIGLIYLGIHCGESYAKFSFTASTSQMSLLFQDSPSVHQVFRNILSKAGGLYGHIDIEAYYEYIPLERPKLRISPKDDSRPVGERDWMLLASLKTIEFQRKQWQKQGNAEAFYKKWVEPFRDILDWPERPNFEQARITFEMMKPYLHEFDDTIFDLLFHDTHPHYIEAATWLTGLSKNEKYLLPLQTFANEHEWYRNVGKYPYSFALVRLGQAIPPIHENWWDKKEIAEVVDELCKLLESPS